MSEHWTKGGTGLTNFHRDQYHDYKAAVDTWDGQGVFWIEERPMDGQGENSPCYSIHCDNVINAQEFWYHCDQVRHLIRTAP